MITIEIGRTADRAIQKVKVSGHAHAAPHGQDIVCAGVSALVQSAVYGLERHLGRPISVRQKQDEFLLELLEQPDQLTDAILETMLLGLAAIAKLHPASVRVRD